MKHFLSAALLLVLSFGRLSAQDTLHIYYSGVNTKVLDSNETKIGKWAKSLNGKKMDIEVLAYYSEKNLKDYAQQRADELFLILNRKAREIINIKSIGPVKGEKSQRSKVDVVYWPAGSREAAAAKAAEEKAALAAKAAEEKAAAEKAKKEEKEKAKGEKKKEEPVAKGEKVKEEKGDKKGSKGKDGEKKKEEVTEAKEKEKDSKKKEKEEEDGEPRASGSNGGLVKASEVKKVKSAKEVVVAATWRCEPADLEFAVKHFWDFNTGNITYMTYNQAKEYAKTHDSIVILSITKVVTKSLSHQKASIGIGLGPVTLSTPNSYKTIASGMCVTVEDAKRHILVSSYVPSYGEGGKVTSESLCFGVSAMNYLLKTMDEKNMGNNMKMESAYKEHSEKLKLKTLYIPEDWLSEKVDKDKISELYKAPYEVVSMHLWAKAIERKKEDVAYVIIVPTPIGGEYVNVHYLMDAQTGMVYAICTPNAMKVSGISVSKANNGLINEKNIEKYNKAITGSW